MDCALWVHSFSHLLFVRGEQMHFLLLCRWSPLCSSCQGTRRWKLQHMGKLGWESSSFGWDGLVLKSIQLDSYPPQCLAAWPLLHPQKVLPCEFHKGQRDWRCLTPSVACEDEYLEEESITALPASPHLSSLQRHEPHQEHRMRLSYRLWCDWSAL